MTMFPPIASFTTENLEPNRAFSRRSRKFAQRSSPFRVEKKPSVIESPKATTTFVSESARTSTPSSQNQEVVEFAYTSPASSAA